MTLEHLDGVEMIAADALSRYVGGAATTIDHSDKIKEIHIQTGQSCWKAIYELLKKRIRGQTCVKKHDALSEHVQFVYVTIS
jgi:hypothetical protein